MKLFLPNNDDKAIKDIKPLAHIGTDPLTRDFDDQLESEYCDEYEVRYFKKLVQWLRLHTYKEERNWTLNFFIQFCSNTGQK